MERIVIQELAGVSADAHTGEALVHASAWADGDANLNALARAFSAWVGGNGRYREVQLMDPDGQVCFAIERSADGKASVVTAAQLARATEARRVGTGELAPHQQLFSAMTPAEAGGGAPLIRVVSPVTDRAGMVSGHLLLACDAGRLQSALADFFQVSSAIKTVLVDPGGGALLDSDVGFGALTASTPGTVGTTRSPAALIAAVQQAGDSRLRLEGGLLVFHHFHPCARLDEVGAAVGSDRLVQAGAERWLAIRFIPDAELHADDFTHSIPGRVAIVAVFTALLAILFSAAYYAERTATARQAQMDLMAARAREVGEVIDGAPGGILVVDREGRGVRANRELEEMLGYAPFELVGQAVDTLIPERFRAAHPGHRAAYARDPMPRRMAEQSPEQSLVARRKDGTEIPVVINLSRISVAGEDWIIATVADMRARREFEAQLTAARDEAQRANQVKRAFLASMSHEIRTPINAIVGLGHLLGHSRLDAEQRRDVDAIQVATRSLLTVINDVLDFSRIEADEMVIEHRAFRPAELLADLRTLFAASATQVGVALSIHDVPATLPTWLSGDPARLHQIAANFLANAIKFAGGECVDLRFEPVGVPEGWKLRVRLSVTDTGIGIDAAAQRRLFDPFVQADASTSRRFGGSGLGLSIVRRLAELMGGEVGCKSRLGGLHLSCRAALRGGQAPAPRQRRRRLLHMKCILLVDDDAMFVRLMAHHLKAMGFEVIENTSGRAVQRDIAQHAPDACLIDIVMEEKDGLETMNELVMADTRAKIIAVSSNATYLDWARGIGVHCGRDRLGRVRVQDVFPVVPPPPACTAHLLMMVRARGGAAIYAESNRNPSRTR